jgi:hypothetical protein
MHLHGTVRIQIPVRAIRFGTKKYVMAMSTWIVASLRKRRKRCVPASKQMSSSRCYLY